jgi:hypothetical protein
MRAERPSRAAAHGAIGLTLHVAARKPILGTAHPRVPHFKQRPARQTLPASPVNRGCAFLWKRGQLLGEGRYCARPPYPRGRGRGATPTSNPVPTHLALWRRLWTVSPRPYQTSLPLSPSPMACCTLMLSARIPLGSSNSEVHFMLHRPATAFPLHRPRRPSSSSAADTAPSNGKDQRTHPQQQPEQQHKALPPPGAPPPHGGPVAPPPPYPYPYAHHPYPHPQPGYPPPGAHHYAGYPPPGAPGAPPPQPQPGAPPPHHPPHHPPQPYPPPYAGAPPQPYGAPHPGTAGRVAGRVAWAGYSGLQHSHSGLTAPGLDRRSA